MFYVKQSESTAARRRVPILMVDETDGSTPEVGLTLYGLLSKNGNTFAATAGTFAEAGYGQYYYQFDTGEIDTLGFAGIHVTATGARNYDAIIHVTSYDAYTGGFISPGDVWNADISAITTAGTAGSQLNLVASGGAGITAGDVWNYATREITGGTATTVTNAVLVDPASMTGIAGTVWNTDVSAFLTPSAGYDLTQAASGGAGITAGDVWEYTLSNLQTADSTLTNTQTYANNAETYAGYANNQTQASAIATAVWDFDIDSAGFNTSPPYAAGYLINAGNGATTAAEQVWNYDISAISGAGLAGTQLNIAASAIGITAGDVWSYATREITGGLANTVTTVTNPVEVSTAAMAGIANTVWSTLTAPYTTHATFGHQILRSDNAATIGEVSLHQSGGSKRVDADVHAFANNTASATAMLNILTGIGASMTTNITGNITGNLSGSVGSVTADVNVSTTSMTGIASTVWNTDISAISTAGTAGSQLNLAASPSGVGISAFDVWNFDPTAMTSPQAGAILTDTQTDTNTIITDIGNIPNNVWSSDISGYVIPGEAGYELTQAASGGAGLTAGAVWNYVLSNTDTAEVNLVAASAGGGVTAGDVWTYDISAISGAGTAGTQLNLAAAGGGAGLTAGEVANAVWTAQLATYATPGTGEVFGTDTYGTKLVRTIIKDRPAAIDTSQRITSVVSAINANVITATSIQAAAITEAKFGTDAISSRVIAADAITSAELAPSANTEIADAVWAYATRNITGGTITTVSDKTGYSLSGSQTFDLTGNITGNISGSVGSVTTVSSGAISAASFLAGAVDAAAVASDAVTEIATGVWSVGTRTITGGTITTVSDKTGYSLSGTQSFNLTGNITGNLSGSVGSVSGSVGSVTGAVGSVTGAVGSVTSDVNVSTTSMSGIAGTVWSTDISSYTSPSAGYSLAVAGSGGVSAADVWNYNGGRTITGGTATTVTNPILVDTTSMSGIAGTVWTYNISGIATTGTAGAVLNDAAVAGTVISIVNGPYRLTSIAEGTDGRIDILADSVQTIQLNCLDGFGQPFNVTGYAVVVNVYDVSGALAVTYTPTVDFASSGIVSFDIDTDVTGTTGRYTLVVELTAGLEVVQLGPLEILVRPL